MSESNKVMEIIESVKHWGKIIKTVCLGAAVIAGSWVTTKLSADKPAGEKHESQQESQTLVGQPKVLPMANPAAPMAIPVSNPGHSSVTFLVQSVGKNKSGKAFLNSMPDYRAAGNQTIVLTGPAAGAQLDAYKGKTVSASGVVSYYRGQPQLEVNDLSQLRVQ